MDYDKIMKAITIRITFILLLLLITFKLSDVMLQGFDINAENTERIEITSDTGQSAVDPPGITFGKYEGLQKTYPSGKMACFSEESSTAEGYNSLKQIKAVFTTASYVSFSSLKLVSGAFFTEKASANGEKMAVISSKLAKNLYSSTNIIGEEIRISGEVYSICGVYSPSNLLEYLLGGDGEERVFIPLKSSAEWAALPIGTMLISDESMKTNEFRVSDLKKALGDNLQLPENAYRINDLYQAPPIFRLKSVLLFILGLRCILKLFGVIIKSCQEYISGIKSRLSEKYPRELLSVNEGLPMLAKLLPVLVAMIFIILLLRLISFNFNIPPDWIPQNNVFDFNFYMERFRAGIIAVNRLQGHKLAQHEAAVKHIENIYLFINLLNAILCMLLYSNLRLLKLLCKAPVKALLKCFGLAFIQVIILSLVYAAASGDPSVLQIKDAVIVGLFMLSGEYSGIWHIFASIDIIKARVVEKSGP